MEEHNHWKRCSSCKKEIPFETVYYLCSVSTCRHPRTGYHFCSVPCWDAHLGYANHRGSAWAEEAKSPDKTTFLRTLQAEPAREPVRKIVEKKPESSSPSPQRPPALFGRKQELDTLVVVSKIKSLIAKESSFSTSQCCIDALSRKVAEMCKEAVEHARGAGRKTVMGRDIK